MAEIYCEACDKTLKGGLEGHNKSKVHIANVELGPAEGTVYAAPVLDERDEYIAELEARIERLRPDKDVPFLTSENLEGLLGREHLVAVAETRLALENQERVLKGLPPLYAMSDTDVYQAKIADEIEKLKTEIVAGQTKWVDMSREGGGTLTMKMVHPSGTTVQHTIEDQVNNGAGAPGANIHLYRDKGFKIMVPYRCQLRDCWATARVVDPDAAIVEVVDGYCTEQHSLKVRQTAKTATFQRVG